MIETLKETKEEIVIQFFCIFLLSTCLMAQYTIDAAPSQVLIIRHAEKASTGDALSLKGKERAVAFVPYFMETKELLNYQTPVAIYAMGPSKEDSSHHAIETVTPLAEKLKLSIKQQFSLNDYKKMVKEIMDDTSYHGKTVLICWGHTLIPEITRAFKALQSPNRWPGELFDRVWIISLESSGKATFQNLPQRLMFGDSSQ